MRNERCQLCNLCQSTTNVCVWGDGNPQHGIFLIGEAPGESEGRTGKPFHGRSGQLLREELRRVGLPEDVYITNLVKCRPPENRKPEPAEIKACSVYLQEEFKEHQPKYVMTLGATPTKALTKSARITEVVGKVIERDGMKYMPCFHPAYVLRDPGKMPEFRRTLKRFKDLVTGNSPQDSESNLEIRIIDRSNLEEFQRQFSGESEFVYDLETSGLDHYAPGSYINCIGMYLPASKTAWVLPIRKSPTLPPDAQKKLLNWMADQEIEGIGHNVKFDSLWLRRKFGVSFYNVFDTMLAHYMLDENSPHGLKELARFHLNAPDYDLTTSEKKGNVDAHKLFTYCARDCYYTYELSRIFRRELMRDKETRNLFEMLIMPIARLYEEIECKGHFVNMDKFRETEKQLSLRLSEVERDLNRIVGYEVNWNSPPQVGKALYGTLGLTPTVFTDKGAPSTGEAALAELSGHPIVEVLTEYRGVDKMLSTYIEGWKKFMVGPYLFLSTKIHGTVTGRFSSRLHQVPRDGTIRNLIEAPEGWTFVQADLSQAELRVAGIVSRDPELIRCYANGIDVHWRTTLQVLRMGGSKEDLQIAYRTVQVYQERRGEPIPKVMSEVLDILEGMGPDEAISINKHWKEKRKQSKGINFGYIYGMGAKKFAEYAKLRYQWEVELHESQLIREGFFHLYAALPSWHDRQRQLVKIDGEVRSLSGRKRRLPGIWSPDRVLSSECERQAINSPVQGFIGDFKAMGMLSLHDHIPQNVLQIKGEVHDSVLMWVRTDKLQETLPKIKYRMENPDLIQELGIELPIPLVVDIEVGPWGAGKTWKGN